MNQTSSCIVLQTLSYPKRKATDNQIFLECEMVIASSLGVLHDSLFFSMLRVEVFHPELTSLTRPILIHYVCTMANKEYLSFKLAMQKVFSCTIKSSKQSLFPFQLPYFNFFPSFTTTYFVLILLLINLVVFSYFCKISSGR